MSRPDSPSPFQYDALLVGGGIMSATLATLLHQVEPSWSIGIVERLDGAARMSFTGYPVKLTLPR